MNRILALVGLCGFLASCGVDGAPIPPEPEEEKQAATQSGSGPTVTVSGEARMGVVRGF